MNKILPLGFSFLLSFFFLAQSLLAQDVTLTGKACNGGALSGSWQVPCGVTEIEVHLYGGGGGGGGGSDGSNGGVFCKDNRAGGGGGGGAYTTRTFSVTPGSSFSYSAGAAGCGGKGAGECSNGNNGTNGGNTTFSGSNAGGTAISLTAGGGAGGKKGDSGGSPGVGGTGGVASGGTTNTNGAAGGNGGKGTYIGGAGGNGAGPLGGAGGTTSSHVHNPGANYGGGGGGGDDDDYGPGANGAPGVIFITYTATSSSIPTPIISSTAATCLANGSSSISNYDPAATYVFTPVGPSVGTSGAISGMTLGTNYTVIARIGSCDSDPSASFKNDPQTTDPATPAVSSAPASCSGDGVATITNYVTSYTYNFTPSGPSAGAGGVISGMTPGTSYTVIADDGSCSSSASASFSIAAQLSTPDVPTITSTPATCVADGSSAISNYDNSYTYTFTPAGPSVAGGAISGMTLGTNYTVEANNGTCSSAPSASFSNIAQTSPPAIPLVTPVPPTCSTDGAGLISNHNGTLTYVFDPAGPSVGSLGEITGMTPGTSYTLEASDGSCTSAKSASFSAAAKLQGPDVPTIASAPATCAADGSSAISNYNGSYTYIFDPTGPSVSTGGAISGMTLGTSYTVKANDGNCDSQESADFSNAAQTSPPDAPTISSTPASCSSDEVSAISNYNAAYTYIFTPTGPTVGAGGAISNAVAGTAYTVISNDGACNSAANASFTNAAQFAAPTVSISGNLTYCAGENTTLTANGGSGVSYAWNDTTNSATASVTLTQGSYEVTVTDANSCTATASVNVSESPQPTVTFTGNLEYCSGKNTTITASGGTSYTWDNGTATASTTLTQGTYTVTVTDANGCSNSDNVSITENPSPVADFSFEPKCLGQEVHFDNLSTGATSYEWNFGNGMTSTDASPDITFVNGGSFNISLTAIEGSCSDTKAVPFAVAAQAKADFTANSTVLVQGKDFLIIDNKSTNADIWEWDFGDLSTSTDFAPQHRYNKGGIYSVTLIASNAGGCADTLTKTNWVKVTDDAILFVPNMFSPNDDGINDFFKIEGGGIKELDLKVFNRWGEKVFETRDINVAWDGYVKGEKAEPGVYSYHLSVTYDILNTEKVSGTILLFR